MSDIEAFLEKTEEDLYFELGAADMRGSATRQPPSDLIQYYRIPLDPRKHGRIIFKKIEAELERRICEEWSACEKLKTEEAYKDEVTLVSAIADIITSIVVGLPVTVISVLIVKIGVRKFCSCPKT